MSSSPLTRLVTFELLTWQFSKIWRFLTFYAQSFQANKQNLASPCYAAWHWCWQNVGRLWFQTSNVCSFVCPLKEHAAEKSRTEVTAWKQDFVVLCVINIHVFACLAFVDFTQVTYRTSWGQNKAFAAMKTLQIVIKANQLIMALVSYWFESFCGLSDIDLLCGCIK